MDNRLNSITRFTKINASDSVQELAPESGHREGLMIFNESTNTLYCKVDGAADVDDFSFKLIPGAYYEMPLEYYTDKVTGIWDGTDGFALVTEIKRI